MAHLLPAGARAALPALAGLPVALPPPVSALAAAGREDELAHWLEKHGCPDGYGLAGGVLDAGLGVAALAPWAYQ
ncbi:hypothetical protein [Hymenobacter fodinae]|uniref:Uncharacterized protein n=1 Tax=Hymenobacter fodinae TaxID=2510796 RepID=A0A4Z0NZ01_9BACT|nr:hypothetical protein [Hymenobacter fodinae]TGE03772.1 hypothetical protein EU556_24485 [Hymenobacter fodinae]